MALVKTEGIPVPESSRALLVQIKDRIRSAQYTALRAVNRELIELYWDIGRIIVERQSGQTWGRSVVQNLAKDLQSEFPGIAEDPNWVFRSHCPPSPVPTGGLAMILWLLRAGTLALPPLKQWE